MGLIKIAEKSQEDKIVNLVEMRVLLNPDLLRLLKAMSECSTVDCAICRKRKIETGIISRI